MASKMEWIWCPSCSPILTGEPQWQAAAAPCPAQPGIGGRPALLFGWAAAWAPRRGRQCCCSTAAACTVRSQSPLTLSLPALPALPAIRLLCLLCLAGRAINEECFAFNESGAYRAFTAARKPVWGVEYCDATKVGRVPCLPPCLALPCLAFLLPGCRRLQQARHRRR